MKTQRQRKNEKEKRKLKDPARMACKKLGIPLAGEPCRSLPFRDLSPSAPSRPRVSDWRREPLQKPVNFIFISFSFLVIEFSLKLL